MRHSTPTLSWALSRLSTESVVLTGLVGNIWPGHDVSLFSSIMITRSATFLCMLFLSVLCVLAQSPGPEEKEHNEKNALESIEEESDGKIHINLSDELTQLLFATPKVGPSKNTSQNYQKQHGAKRTGYRIQVFSDGHNPSSLQARARARGNAIAARLPKYRGQVYTFSRSPNWYTTVGNFSSLSEANSALRELRRAFPSFASEMRVVKSSIVILK